MSGTQRLGFSVDGRDSTTAARATTVTTPRGSFRTPAFMPVGTAGSVKSVSPDELRAVGAEIILGNTYHLYLRPGESVLRRFGGLHRFMDWEGPILTDSGGYQFFSLARLARMDEEGVSFQSHIDGSRHRFTPESCIGMQGVIGSDIMMVLDECPALPAPRDALERAIERTTRWSARALDAARELPGALFGIVQGGTETDLRLKHLAVMSALPFAGLALGGFSVGEPTSATWETLAEVGPRMPDERPRYLMGVGRPEDIVTAIGCGIDMFDCVMPTRNARNASLFTRTGKLNLRNARHAGDERPVDAACACLACSRFSRGYLHHLYRSGELLALRLGTLHNLRYYIDLTREARQAILESRFDEWRRGCTRGWERGENC